jgi:hypothetical protein
VDIVLAIAGLVLGYIGLSTILAFFPIIVVGSSLEDRFDTISSLLSI